MCVYFTQDQPFPPVAMGMLWSDVITQRERHRKAAFFASSRNFCKFPQFHLIKLHKCAAYFIAFFKKTCRLIKDFWLQPSQKNAGIFFWRDWLLYNIFVYFCFALNACMCSWYQSQFISKIRAGRQHWDILTCDLMTLTSCMGIPLCLSMFK